MPIPVACQCGKKFAAKDELAGRKVKCPGCGEPLAIPKAQSAAANQPAPTPRQQPQQPAAPAGGLDDLFDEAGIGQASAGPRCPACSSPIRPGAMLCTDCGFNLQTGQRLNSQAAAGPSMVGDASYAEEQVRKAAEELKKTPMTQKDGDFGEGTNPAAYVLMVFLPALLLLSFFIVCLFGAPIGGFAVAVIGAIFTAPILALPAIMGLIGSVLIMISWFRLTWAALDEGLLHGILCLATLAYAPIFGIIHHEKYLRTVIMFGVGILLVGLAVGGFILMVVLLSIALSFT